MNTRREESYLLPDRNVYDTLGISRSTFYRLLEKGIISAPIGKLGKNRRGWSPVDINLARQEFLAFKEDL